jgi:ABC-2 type transport system permease protein
MKPIYMRVLKERRLSMFWWCLGISGFIALNLAIYPSLKNQGQELSRTIASLPQAVQSLFGNTGDIFSPSGYLNARQYYFLLPIMIIILAIGLGSSLLAREEQSHTLELLLSRPISRVRLLMAKALAGWTVLLVVNAVVAVVTVALIRLINMDISTTNVLLAHLQLFLLASLFGALAFLFTAFGKTARLLSVGVTSLVALLAYILTSLKGLAGWLEWPAKVLPYDYYKPAAILNGSFSWRTALAYLAIAVALTALAWVGFRRRDIE